MVKLTPVEELRLLVKVSKLYYEEKLTQDDIILRLNLSRTKISRLLQQARDEGIVQIIVATPEHLYSNLELQLEKTYGLQEAIVIEANPGDSRENIIYDLGVAAAGYLESSLGRSTILGISWGSTLRSMVSALQSNPIPDSKVVQVIGGLGQPELAGHATDLCHRMARSLGSQLILLPAPGIVSSEQARDVLLVDPSIKQAIDLFDHLDIVFVGIGAPGTNSILMKDGAIISRIELNDLLQKGCVGDIALRFFNQNGNPIQSDIDKRVIGISLEQLKRVKRVVGIAGGSDKYTAILAALRGRLVNVLITDSMIAEKLLQ